MESALRPHRGGTVLALGILSVVIPLTLISFGIAHSNLAQWFIPAGIVVVPLGLVAGVLGWKQLAGMKGLRIDPAGRPLARTGQVLGVVGAGGWTALTLFVLYQVSKLFSGEHTIKIEVAAGTQRIVQSFSEGQILESENYEVLRPDGSWVREGHSVRWSPHTHDLKVEEGSYRDGKRDGPWTFWNEDGSIDTTKSGTYENDVQVDERVPSPAGDYRPRPGGNPPRPPLR